MLHAVSQNVHTSSFYCVVHACTTPWKMHIKIYIIAHQLKYTHIYIYNWGFGLKDITTPLPLFMHYPQCIMYPCTTKFSKSSKRCGYSTLIASSCSQVASSGPYQVHWTFTSPMARSWSCLIFRSIMHTECT
jgi:hypothetical protein